MRSALIVRGGAEFHDPVGTTDSFLPYLKDQGFSVEIAEDLAVYDDRELLARTDLVVSCWTGGSCRPSGRPTWTMRYARAPAWRAGTAASWRRSPSGATSG
ncbi:hypothetical protein ACFQY4_11360 [Catellatospora bangladeshensis]|uniref:hypothetical protein n=1 Tax=Catellatospora bangladeshensis TaxID=310355 RepID=UPI00362039B5